MASSDIIVNLITKHAKFDNGMRRANRSLSQTAKAARLFTNVIRAAGLALGGIGVGRLVSQNLDLLDSYNKLNDRLGISVKAISALGFAAQQTGVQTRQLELGLQRMTRRVSEAAQGMGEAQSALKELRLDAKEFNRLPIEQQFAVLADRFEDVSDSSDKVRLAFKLFDAEGVGLLQTMKGGSEALREYAARAEELGAVFDKETVEAATRAKDEINELKTAFSALATNLVAEMSPALARFAEDLNTALFGGEIAKLTRESRRLNEAIAELSTVGENSPGFKATQEVILSLYEDLRSVSDQLVGLRELARVEGRGETIIAQLSDEAEEAITLTRELGGQIPEIVPIDAIRTSGEFFNGMISDLKETEALATDLGMTFSSAFEDAVVEGRKLRDVMKGLLDDILRIFIRMSITNPFTSALTGALGGLNIGGGAGGGGGLGRALGGSVTSGKPYQVGEQGPEWFIPTGSGRILPNGRGGGGGMNVTYTIDARGVDEQRIMQKMVPLLQQTVETTRSLVRRDRMEGLA